ncbi:hypothetical protein RHMOL_Rhmol08G0223600 [Rhododendron molle]|uniref:Uncharacterized protein n=1 Tax=Rhododendron molle TaxID=49168 RepID=A0ACC0MR46_RHOML|nr:hypothetical protein RHMOL_Rhmol08G0223600 [Rhododendron molle]
MSSGPSMTSDHASSHAPSMTSAPAKSDDPVWAYDMERYYKTKPKTDEIRDSQKQDESSPLSKRSRADFNLTELPSDPRLRLSIMDCNPNDRDQEQDESSPLSKRSRVELNLTDLPANPGLRPSVMDCNPNDRDQIRRA